MTGYAVSARIQHIHVGRPDAHAPFAGRGQESSPACVPGERVVVADGIVDQGALEDLEGASAWVRFADLRDDLATAWRQTTFFLFDPQSWR